MFLSFLCRGWQHYWCLVIYCLNFHPDLMPNSRRWFVFLLFLSLLIEERFYPGTYRLSFRGVLLSLFVSKAIFAVPNKKGSALSWNMNIAFYELSNGDVVRAGLFAVLVHLFKSRITFLFVSFSPSVSWNFVGSMGALISSLNWTSIISACIPLSCLLFCLFFFWSLALQF